MFRIVRVVVRVIAVCMMVNSLITLAQMAQAQTVAAQWNY